MQNEAQSLEGVPDRGDGARRSPRRRLRTLGSSNLGENVFLSFGDAGDSKSRVPCCGGVSGRVGDFQSEMQDA